MWFLKLVVFLWTFYALTLDTDAFSCPKGHMVLDLKQKKSCKPCPKGYFQDVENQSQHCKTCRKCDESTGSEVKEKCTSDRNRICKCRENFVFHESDSTTCKCADGYLKKFQDCVLKENNQAIVTTSNKISHLLPSLTSPRPQEGAHTQKPTHNNNSSSHPGSTTPQKPTHNNTTSSHPGSTTTTKEKTRDSHTSYIILGLTFLMVTLLVLTALICKQNILPHMKRKPEQTRDPSFRTPVEESGDGSQDLLKQNSEEP